MLVDHEAISIAFIVVKCMAVTLTLFRLGFRLKIQRFWWEDVWAVVALFCTVISIVDSVLAVSGTPSHDGERILIASRVNVYIFLSIVWSVRLSLIFDIIRITHATLQRRLALAVAACYFLFWITMLGFQAWYSDRISPRKDPPDCVIPRFIIILEMMLNCLSDAMNVVFPFRLLWRVKLPPRQRRMVLSIFFASRFLCMFSLARSITQLVGSRTIQRIFTNVQITAFLIVCNLLVVVTYVYRVFLTSNRELSSRSDELSDDDDFTTPAPRSGMQDLTTVDLESLRISVAEATSELKSELVSSTAPSMRSSNPER